MISDISRKASRNMLRNAANVNPENSAFNGATENASRAVKCTV